MKMAFGLPKSEKVKAAFERYEAAEAALVRTKDLEQALAEITILKAFIEDLRQAF
jgi:3-methyladenine DNA glycosylase Tag